MKEKGNFYHNFIENLKINNFKFEFFDKYYLLELSKFIDPL